MSLWLVIEPDWVDGKDQVRGVFDTAQAAVFAAGEIHQEYQTWLWDTHRCRSSVGPLDSLIIEEWEGRKRVATFAAHNHREVDTDGLDIRRRKEATSIAVVCASLAAGRAASG